MRARLLVCVCVCVCSRGVSTSGANYSAPVTWETELQKEKRKKQRIRTMPPRLSVDVSSMCAAAVAARCLVFRRPETGGPPSTYRACATMRRAPERVHKTDMRPCVASIFRVITRCGRWHDCEKESR